jgi:hypothetical protein
MRAPSKMTPSAPFFSCSLSGYPLLCSLLSPFTVGYLDGFSLGGRENMAVCDIDNEPMHGAALGLDINITKCEVIGRRYSIHKIGTVNLATLILLDPEDSSPLGVLLLVGG